MEAHTNGKWEYEEIFHRQGSGFKFWSFVVKNANQSIATIVKCGGGKREMEANAKLIAASPKLLKALIEISNGVGKGVSQSFIQEIATEAIKKATE